MSLDKAFEEIDRIFESLFEKLNSVPGKIYYKVDNMQKGAAAKLEKTAEVAAVLAERPDVFDKFVGDLSIVFGRFTNVLDTTKLSGYVANGLGKLGSTLMDAITKAMLYNQFTAPIMIAAEKGAKVVETVSGTAEQIVDQVADSVDKALELPPPPGVPKGTELNNLQPPPPPITGPDTNHPKIIGGQSGGAKTRRHLKKMIRERQLIQTRTNKMIHEFMNPSLKTQNKKHIIKKTKRRRRR